MKGIFQYDTIVYERESSYFDNDYWEFTADENHTIVANYDSTPRRKLLLPGENGDGVVIPFYRMKEEEAGYKQHGFNSLASDIIPLERRLKDCRRNE